MTNMKSNSFWEEYGLEPWPGRYCVTANGIFKYKGRLYSTSMYMASIHTGEEYRKLLCDAGFSEPINGKDFINLVCQINDRFSEQEADELVTFLNSIRGFQEAKWQAIIPRKDTPGRLLNVLNSINGLTMYELSREEEFNLDFPVDANIDLSDYKKISYIKILIRDILKRLTIGTGSKTANHLKMVIDLTEEINLLKQYRTFKEPKQGDRKIYLGE